MISTSAKRIFIPLLLILGLMLCLSGVLPAKSNESAQALDISDREQYSGESSYPYWEIDTVVDAEDSFIGNLTIRSQAIIRSFSYACAGLEVVSASSANRTIAFCLRCVPAEKHELTVNIVLSSGEELRAPLFGVNYENKLFLSSASADDALENYIDYALIQGSINEKTANDLRMENMTSCPFSIYIDERTADIREKTRLLGTVTVSGTAKWTDDQSNIHFAMGLKVEAYDDDIISGQILLGTTYTGTDGTYSISFSNTLIGRDVYVKIYTENDAIRVAKANGTVYYWLSATTSNIQSDTTVNFSVDMTNYGDLGKAIQIYQALYAANVYANVILPDEGMDLVTLKYPISNIGIECNISTFTISLGNSGISGYPAPYAAWDIIMEYYGKMVAYSVGIYYSSTAEYPLSFNLSDHLNNTETGVKTAWSLAWPKVFALIAQNYFGSNLTNIATVNNALFESFNAPATDFETVSVYNGEGCPLSVIAVLWDLLDSNSDGTDSVSLSSNAWAAISANTAIGTFSSFIASTYELYPRRIDDIGRNLTTYKMAPIFSAPTNASSTIISNLMDPVVVTLDLQGGSNSFPNNQACITYYSEDYSSHYTDYFGSSTTVHLNFSAFNYIKAYPGDNIHVFFGAGQYTSPWQTGYYYSTELTVSKKIFKYSLDNNNQATLTNTYCDLIDDALDIPATIDGYPIKALGNNLFENNTIIKYVDFESNSAFRTIGQSAFRYSALLSINLPPSTTSIGANAFSFLIGDNNGTPTVGYGSLFVGYTGSTLTTIGDNAFWQTKRPGKNVIPNSVTTVGNYAFAGSQLQTSCQLSMSSNLQTIGQNAFASNNMNAFVLKSTITSVGSYAFYNCPNLTIYTQHASKPSGWNSNWNPDGRPVIWGCSLSNGGDYVASFTKTASNPSVTSGISDPYRSGYTFKGWTLNSDGSGTVYTCAQISSIANNTVLYSKWEQESCVAEGTLITLADGSQVAVEDLTGDEYLLVWNMLTGQYDSAPILFIDSDPQTSYEIIKLTFSDGTEVKVISEHAFFDMTLGEYVFLRNDAAQYIGHYFNKQSTNGTWTTVQLTNVTISTELTTAWSPVTYGHLCYYVNGMLSMPGATEGFINIFDVDATLMKYDATQMATDIQTYGLYTYEEFNAIIPLPELVFNAFNGQYLKVSIGKGLITLEEIAALLVRYSQFF